MHAPNARRSTETAPTQTALRLCAGAHARVRNERGSRIDRGRNTKTYLIIFVIFLLSAAMVKGGLACTYPQQHNKHAEDAFD